MSDKKTIGQVNRSMIDVEKAAKDAKDGFKKNISAGTRGAFGKNQK